MRTHPHRWILGACTVLALACAANDIGLPGLLGSDASATDAILPAAGADALYASAAGVTPPDLPPNGWPNLFLAIGH